MATSEDECPLYFEAKHRGTNVRHEGRFEVEVPLSTYFEPKPGAPFRKDLQSNGPDKYYTYAARYNIWLWFLHRRDMVFWIRSRRIEETGDEVAVVVFDCPKNALLFKLTWG